jgi:UDP-glucose 4-epimerase
MKNILVTGGLGFIGSHIVVDLIQSGEYSPIIVDNLSNSKESTLDRIQELTRTRPTFYKADVCDLNAMTDIFNQHKFDGVIHLAGLKAVNESIQKPLLYYQNNLLSTLVLLEVMQKYAVYTLIFSSSATVYGSSTRDGGLQETDTTGVGITNPYGKTKFFIEHILEDVVKSKSDSKWNICSLRYFNPVGAHPSGLIGEDPLGLPNNLMPWILRAVNKKMVVFGNDYPTRDGTCIRDFIHVMDLAAAHRLALSTSKSKYEVINVGTGTGTTVTELITTFEKVNQVKLNWEFGPRREGDLAATFCDPSKAMKLINWKATRTTEDICRDAWTYFCREKLR